VTILVRLPSAQAASIRVYDALGRHVRTLVCGARDGGGALPVAWDLCDASGRTVPAGVYLCAVESGQGRSTQRIVVE
jgi:hypothetical protein